MAKLVGAGEEVEVPCTRPCTPLACGVEEGVEEGGLGTVLPEGGRALGSWLGEPTARGDAHLRGFCRIHHVTLIDEYIKVGIPLRGAPHALNRLPHGGEDVGGLGGQHSPRHAVPGLGEVGEVGVSVGDDGGGVGCLTGC